MQKILVHSAICANVTCDGRILTHHQFTGITKYADLRSMLNLELAELVSHSELVSIYVTPTSEIHVWEQEF
jgi:hypothetical protein